MSEPFNAVADAMANAETVETPQAPADDSAPQAVETAETPAEETAPPASADTITDASQTDAPETPSRAEKRIQQLLQREREARERIAYLEGLTQAGKPADAPREQAPTALPADLSQWVGEEPKPEAFPAGEFDPQYLRAIAKFEARHEQAQFVTAQRQMAQRQAEEARARTLADDVVKAEKDRPDFREVVGGLGNRLANWQANLIAEAGVEIAYAIGKDAAAEEAIRSARTPVAAAREIGRIEARLEAAKAAASAPPAAPPQPSNAPPPPPKSVRGASTVGFDWSKASPAEIQARINAAGR
jgi:hypothetical protein